MNVVDMRSDTVTRPTSSMWDAMRSAELGDDVLGDDPTVQALQRRAADMLGKEAALFVPSGTMANQIAIRLHTQPGDSIVMEATAHPFNYEAAGALRTGGRSARRAATGTARGVAAGRRHCSRHTGARRGAPFELALCRRGNAPGLCRLRGQIAAAGRQRAADGWEGVKG